MRTLLTYIVLVTVCTSADHEVLAWLDGEGTIPELPKETLSLLYEGTDADRLRISPNGRKLLIEKRDFAEKVRIGVHVLKLTDSPEGIGHVRDEASRKAIRITEKNTLYFKSPDKMERLQTSWGFWSPDGDQICIRYHVGNEHAYWTLYDAKAGKLLASQQPLAEFLDEAKEPYYRGQEAHVMPRWSRGGKFVFGKLPIGLLEYAKPREENTTTRFHAPDGKNYRTIYCQGIGTSGPFAIIQSGGKIIGFSDFGLFTSWKNSAASLRKRNGKLICFVAPLPSKPMSRCLIKVKGMDGVVGISLQHTAIGYVITLRDGNKCRWYLFRPFPEHFPKVLGSSTK